MNTMYAILYTILWPFFNLFHPGRAVGRENIPTGGALVCSNHTTLSDPLFIVFAFRKKNRLRAMAKSELMNVPVIGWLLNKAGIFGVNRGKSDIAAIKLALKVLKDGEKLLLFPEGTRHSEGEAKTGAAMLAIRSGVPIVPVYIPREKKWFRPTTVIIGEPYYPEVQNKRATNEDYRAVSDDLMARIHALGEQAER